MLVMENAQELPSITDNQSWCCERGCGDCKPVQIDFEYSRTEDLNGSLLKSKTEKVWASNCCHSGLMLWDEDKQDFVSL